ncbi:MAG: zf-HC2 domain-containing protein [Solirubrobacteraceae bacterium]
MGQGDYSPSPLDCGDDVAAYALGALEDHERERFEHHLESCAVCSDELAAFEQAVALLLISAPQRPASQGLRRRLMAEVSRDAGRRGESLGLGR